MALQAPLWVHVVPAKHVVCVSHGSLSTDRFYREAVTWMTTLDVPSYQYPTVGDNTSLGFQALLTPAPGQSPSVTPLLVTFGHMDDEDSKEEHCNIVKVCDATTGSALPLDTAFALLRPPSVVSNTRVDIAIANSKWGALYYFTVNGEQLDQDQATCLTQIKCTYINVLTDDNEEELVGFRKPSESHTEQP